MKSNMNILHLITVLFVIGNVVCLEFEGKEFSLAFFPNYVSMYGRSVTGHLFFRTRSAGTCSISDQDGKLHSIKVTPNNITQFDTQSKFYSLGTYVAKRGIKISCSVSVGMYGLATRVPDLGASTAFYMLPLTSPGEYYLPSVPNNAFIGIVASEDNTSVSVDVISNCQVPSGSKTLSSRDVYQLGVETSGRGVNCDLGGTRVSSSKPVTVYSGATILVYPLQHGGQVQNQVQPVTSWGREYVVPMITNMDQQTMRIIGSKNNTKVTIFNSDANTTQVVLQEREIMEEALHPDTNVFLSSSEPILVSQIAGNNDGYTAITSIVSAVEDYGTNYVIPDVQAPGRHFQRYVTLITESQCTSEIGVKANWTSLDAGKSSYSVTLLEADDSLRTITSKTSRCRFGVQVTGFAQYEAYAYFATPSETN